MHHHPHNQEGAINLSILSMSGPGKFSRVESNLSSSCSARISKQGPLCPTLRANPFPKVTDLFCRLPLPTLIYQPEAVNLGDLMRLWVRARVQINTHIWLFKDSWRHTGHLRRQSALPTKNPISRQSVFRVACGKKEKITLSKASTCSAKAVYVTIKYPHLGWRILTQFPFKAQSKARMNRITLPLRFD